MALVPAILFFLFAGSAVAESPAPTMHWGGLAYPDQVNTLSLGYIGNRFTQFDGDGAQFNRISETMGFNFGSLSWTQHWQRFEGFSTNLTIGAGPTGEQPTRYLQNEFIHDTIYNIPKVPVGRTRDEFDFSVDASATYWHSVFDAPRVFFIGGGISTGSLYTEGFGRTGLRRFPIGCLLAGTMGRCTGHLPDEGLAHPVRERIPRFGDGPLRRCPHGCGVSGRDTGVAIVYGSSLDQLGHLRPTGRGTAV